MKKKPQNIHKMGIFFQVALYFCTIFLHCVFALYFSPYNCTIFLHCIFALYVYTVFLHCMLALYFCTKMFFGAWTNFVLCLHAKYSFVMGL